MENQKLLTLGQAAALVGVSRQTIHRWVHDGKLECVTLPPAAQRAGRWRYVRQGDVERLAAEKRCAGLAPPCPAPGPSS